MAQTTSTPLRKVLVGTDGSESSFRAVDRAAEIAAGVGATLLLASAYRPLTGRVKEAAEQALGSEAFLVEGSRPAEDVLVDAGARATAAGVAETETFAREGDPVEVLLEVARDEGVDLIVVGNRGLNTLTGRLLGSVPADITHRAPCDVLVVHTTSGKR